jgi:hypothetical protein
LQQKKRSVCFTTGELLLSNGFTAMLKAEKHTHTHTHTQTHTTQTTKQNKKVQNKTKQNLRTVEGRVHRKDVGPVHIRTTISDHGMVLP